MLKIPQTGQSKTRKILKTAIAFAGFCLLISILIGLALFAYFIKDLPDPAKINQREIVQSTKIYDRTGEIILYDIHDEEKRTVISFEEIPQNVKDATVVAEDDNFYHHFGVDLPGILKSAWLLIVGGGKIQRGGSTITQQYIKNAYLGGPHAERTFTRKIKEGILALILERKYSKNEILGFYLNQVPYGSNAYGIEAASQTYFNKSAQELTLAESALLAAMPQLPSYYSPYGSHTDELKDRQEFILERMVKFGYITESEAEEAKKEELNVSQTDLKAHHFVTMVKEYLEKKYSSIYSDINKAGLKVYTTLDWDLQQIAEEVIEEGAAKNKEKYKADNAALAAIDPQTGQILALVGSRSYKEEQFNVAISPFRQPGSSFKPFAYAAALEKGYTPETILFDLQTNFRGNDIKDYIPNNYDLKFRGPISMKNSLAQSVNVTSVKTLYLAGVNNTIDLAQDMGITTLKDRSSYGLALVLGGGEVKLLDETAAYGVFAAEGIRHPSALVLKVEDAYGNVLEEYQDAPKRVLSQQTARQINSILSDEAARAPVFGSHSKLYLGGRPAAAKTGTTQDYSDGWTVGYTSSLVAGVWAGNNDYRQKMSYGAAGIYVAAPIWNEFMKRAYQSKIAAKDIVSSDNKEKKEDSLLEEIELAEFILPEEMEYFEEPALSPTTTKPMLNGTVALQKKVSIDKVSGKLATALTPPELIEERIYQQVHSILYYVDKDEPLGDYPENPEADPQFSAWESTVLIWASEQSCTTGEVCYNQNPPAQYDDVHVSENQPKVKITSPRQNQIIDLSSSPIFSVAATASGALGIKQVDFFVNNQLIDSDSTLPYSVSFNIRPYLTGSDRQTIKVRAYDTLLNTDEDTVTITIK